MTTRIDWSELVKAAWDKTPTLRLPYTGASLAITVLAQLIAWGTNASTRIVVSNTVVFILSAWLLVSWVWFIVSLIRVPAELNAQAQERIAAFEAKKPELLTSIASEAHDVRYKLALVALRVRGKYSLFDKATFDLLRTVIQDHKGIEHDTVLAAHYRETLERGEKVFLESIRPPDDSFTTLFPVPYHLAFLQANLAALSIFPPATQEILLRINAEIDLYNEQVAIVRTLHDRTFDSAMIPENRKIIRNNLNAATKTLGTRAEITVGIIGKFVDSKGRFVTPV